MQKRLDDLHQSQLVAYREAATEGLREWARTMAPLQPMEDNDNQNSFVERCVSAVVASSWPNWRVPSANLIISLEIRKRARATFAKYNVETAVAKAETAPIHQEEAKDDAAQVSNDEDNGEENTDENDDEGELFDEDDGEMDDEDDDEGQPEDETTGGKTTNNQGGAKKKNNKGQNRKKKAIVRKKGTAAKQTMQNRKGATTRARRPRGGGAAGAK